MEIGQEKSAKGRFFLILKPEGLKDLPLAEILQIFLDLDPALAGERSYCIYTYEVRNLRTS